MALYLEDREIPAALARKIVALSLVSVGRYNWEYHRFIAEGFQPDLTVIKAVREEAGVFGFTNEEADEIVPIVLSNVGTEPQMSFCGSINLAGDDEIPVLSHLSFREENNGITEVLYLGNQFFYVISTTRSTIARGNLLKAREFPLNRNSVWNFDIFSDFNSEEASIPEGYKKYKAWFCTTPVVEIVSKKSPEFFEIIDGDDRFGGRMSELEDARDAVSILSDKVRSVVSVLTEYDKGQPDFPKYSELLSEAKQRGIPSYVLNVLIESREQYREVSAPAFNEKDWYVYKTPEQIAQEKKEQYKRDSARYKELWSELEQELDQIHRRRVLLFFDAPGVVNAESRKHIGNIGAELDQLAQKGFGTPGAWESRLSIALNNTKPRPRHNLKVSLICAAVAFVIGFVGWSWIRARISSNLYAQAMEKVDQMVQEDKFTDAANAIDQAYQAFKPKYLRFLKKGETQRRHSGLEDAIDSFVVSRIDQVNILIRANHGIIDNYTWSLITEAMEYRPENQDLLALRARYIAQ